MEQHATQQIKSAQIEATVIRADGRIEELGRISYWHRNPFKRWGWALGKMLRNFLKFTSPVRSIIGDNKGMATLLVATGRAITTGRLKAVGTEPLNIGWGTGAGTTVPGDTTLFAEKDVDLATATGLRTAGTSSQVTVTSTNDTYQVTGTRTATGAGTVTNAGLWDDVDIGEGSLYMKGDFTGIGLSIGDSINFTMKVQYS